MLQISNESSKRITSLRYILAIFIVFIHNNLNANDAINYYHLEFNEPSIVTWIKLIICEVLGGGVVPLFFLFAGYIQSCKNDNFTTLLKKKTKSLLVPYLLWILLAVLFLYLGQAIPKLSPFFQNGNNIVRDFSLVDWLNIFWAHGTNSLHPPLVPQLWFIRDLFIIVLFTPLFRIFTQKIKLLFFAIIIYCYLIGLPLGFGTALFFYISGFSIGNYEKDLFNWTDKIKWIEIIILLIVETLTRIFVPNTFNFYGIDKIIACIFFMKLSSCLIKQERFYAILNFLSRYSFFLYAVHMPFISTVFNKVSYRIIPLHGIGCLVQFILPTIATVFFGTLLGIILKRFIPIVFSLFNGGRK